MWRDFLGEACTSHSGMKDAPTGVGRGMPGLSPTGKEPPLGAVLAEVVAHEREKALRQHRVTIPAALAGTHVDDHTLGVDVFGPQPAGLGNAQPCGVLGHHDRLVLGHANGTEQCLDLSAAQNHRQSYLPAPHRQVLDLGLASQRDGVQEDQRCADLAVGLVRDLLLFHHVEQVLADLVLAHLRGRAHVVLAEELGVSEVDFAGRGAIPCQS